MPTSHIAANLVAHPEQILLMRAQLLELHDASARVTYPSGVNPTQAREAGELRAVAQIAADALLRVLTCAAVTCEDAAVARVLDTFNAGGAEALEQRV